MKKEIRKYTLDKLEDLVVSHQQPLFRAKQIDDWLWKKSASSISDMTNLPQSFRNKLEEAYDIYKAQIAVEQKSQDGTIKLGVKLTDGRMVEAVLIPTENRMTACISSQVGCTLHCQFCATGQLKRERNLTAAEIYDQVELINNKAIECYDQKLSNIVYMGMGEPLLNYDEVIRSIEKLTNGLGFGQRRITVSTVGIARAINRLADEGRKINLAWSLHAATNEKRAQIMDINKSNPIEEVADALAYYYSKTKNKITFEYILFNEFNDFEEDAKALIKLCKKVPAFVNLIEYNKVEGVQLKKSIPARRDAFVQYLESKGITAKVRISRGEDIDAACGQLANKH